MDPRWGEGGGEATWAGAAEYVGEAALETRGGVGGGDVRNGSRVIGEARARERPPRPAGDGGSGTTALGGEGVSPIARGGVAPPVRRAEGTGTSTPSEIAICGGLETCRRETRVAAAAVAGEAGAAVAGEISWAAVSGMARASGLPIVASRGAADAT